MNQNIEFLNYIHQNSEMGKETIGQLIEINKDEKFGKLLKSQYNEYKKIFDAANNMLSELGKACKDISIFAKITTYISLNLSTMMDKTPSHISEMLIEGSTMGIIDITKHIKEYKDASDDIKNLAHDLLVFEERNLEECKKFL